MIKLIKNVTRPSGRDFIFHVKKRGGDDIITFTDNDLEYLEDEELIQWKQ